MWILRLLAFVVFSAGAVLILRGSARRSGAAVHQVLMALLGFAGTALVFGLILVQVLVRAFAAWASDPAGRIDEGAGYGAAVLGAAVAGLVTLLVAPVGAAMAHSGVPVKRWRAVFAGQAWAVAAAMVTVPVVWVAAIVPIGLVSTAGYLRSFGSDGPSGSTSASGGGAGPLGR